jgi:site-specific recombinase XerD
MLEWYAYGLLRGPTIRPGDVRSGGIDSSDLNPKEYISLRGTAALDDRSVWMQLEVARLAAGLYKFSMHDLRRAWASAVHHNGASLKQVSVWLGHADIATTERYIRVFDQRTSGHAFLPR